jgi:pimeloyl-ACP methyl ester carboxylesterase
LLSLLQGKTRLCVLERAGYGHSEPSPPELNRTIEVEAVELHAALRGAGESGPFILVGFSHGGLNALTFADRFNESVCSGTCCLLSSHCSLQDIAGIVLVDAPAPGVALPQRLKDLESLTTFVLRSAPYLARLGVIRVINDITTFLGLYKVIL